MPSDTNDAEVAARIFVSVVVSGQEVELAIGPRALAAELCLLALGESGISEDKEISDWELRRADGTLIEPGVKLSDAGVGHGHVVYMSPRAGAAGAREVANAAPPAPETKSFAELLEDYRALPMFQKQLAGHALYEHIVQCESIARKTEELGMEDLAERYRSNARAYLCAYNMLARA